MDLKMALHCAVCNAAGCSLLVYGNNGKEHHFKF